MDSLGNSATKFVEWLDRRIQASGRGEDRSKLDRNPTGLFWLGRLTSEASVMGMGLGVRGERLDPCATGLRIQPARSAPWTFKVAVSGCLWLKKGVGQWAKTEPFALELEVTVQGEVNEHVLGGPELKGALKNVGAKKGTSGEIRIVCHEGPEGWELEVTLVNTSSPEADDEAVFYETSLSISGIDTEDFILESLPDSFRYDRRVPSYGINCGVGRLNDGSFKTEDAIVVNQGRRTFWSIEETPPNLDFDRLASDPLPPLKKLVAQYERWGDAVWATESLEKRARQDLWSQSMLDQAKSGALEFREELRRLIEGISLLQENDDLRAAFSLMNRAMVHSARGRYSGWRAFQIGFLLANIKSLVDRADEAAFADVVWFSTGGGKTETYLGLLVTAAFYDRLRGKCEGVTAWSRFPLRMLSLQQTQRFADALAGAEIVRRQAGVDGTSFSCGFFVGGGATPNRIENEPRDGEPDAHDPAMPRRYQVLLRCPFCFSESIEMTFNRRTWCLEHRCTESRCSWPEAALPFFVVDEEIYRFLPTVLIGTLDKAALISMQASMRGFVGPPHGICSEEGHGYTYATRSSRPTGCLVPGCRGEARDLETAPELFGPSFRLQDELHLLKDSLGAVDSHYEALLDHLQSEISSTVPKILASSATLTGYEHQTQELYRRIGRVFPAQGPDADKGFWTTESADLMRRYVAVAPRGVTLEFATDRIITELQIAIRYLVAQPREAATEIGIPEDHVADIVSLYGTDVVYGSTLRDLDAVIRSLQTQVPVEGKLNSATLTGRTDFDEVRKTLKRLDQPEPNFDDRIHTVVASAMMSHGVDIDRLNVMVMLGLPLSTSEFIQATARVGRRWPGLVFVLHKIVRERDSGVYRSFAQFVRQGDRFVEAVPVTTRSRRVLEKTLPGFVLARLLMVHEPRAGGPLTTVSKLREYLMAGGYDVVEEVEAICSALGFEREQDAALRADIRDWLTTFVENIQDPVGRDIRFPSQLSPTGKPMISLRDVEAQIPITGYVE